MADRYNNLYRIETTRASWHDYRGGSYFVTVCTKDREPYFGHIEEGQMKYTNLGQSANDCLREIPSHFPYVDVPEFVVMPNHIHAIIIINTPVDPVETQDFASLQKPDKTQQKFGPQSRNLASVVRGFKIGVTKFANKNDIPFAWQSRFHDHIIRDQNEMNQIVDYIMNNVASWEDDGYNQNNLVK